MDADDIMKTDRIEKQWQLFQKNPNLVITGSNIIEFGREHRKYFGVS